MKKIDFKIHLDSLRFVPAGMLAIWAVQQSLALGSAELYLPSYILLGLVILFTLFAVWLCIRNGYITRFEMVVLSFLLIVMVSSILNATDFKNWAFVGFAILLPLFLFRFYGRDCPALLVGLLLGFSVSIYAGLIDLLSHPEKWMNMERGESMGYLLGGNYNQMAPIIMCAITINFLCIKISKWYWLNAIPLLGVSIAILLIVNSSTALAGMALMLFLMLIPSKKLQRISVYCILISVILFEIFVCFQGKGFENNELARWIIIDVLGKDMTFTYRTHMWDSAIKLIIDSPLIGYGFPSPEWYVANMTAFAVGPHNAVLAMLIYGGIVALAIYVYVLVVSLRRVLTVSDRFANVSLCSLAVISLMMLFEIYTIPFVFTLFFLAYYYPEFDQACHRKNRPSQP